MSDQSTPVTRLPLRKGASLRWLPFLFIFLQSVLYGLGDPISKSAYEVLPVYSLLTARYGERWMTHPTSFRKEDA